MTIEKLTGEERELLSRGGGVKVLVGAKALRIIDQLTAALEVAETALARNLPQSYWNGKASAAATAAESRAEALQARVAELESERDELQSELESAREGRENIRNMANEAETELADLRGRVERAIEALECLGAPIWMPAGARRALEVLRGR